MHCNAVQCSAVHCSAVQCTAVQCSLVQLHLFTELSVPVSYGHSIHCAVQSSLSIVKYSAVCNTQYNVQCVQCVQCAVAFVEGCQAPANVLCLILASGLWTVDGGQWTINREILGMAGEALVSVDKHSSRLCTFLAKLQRRSRDSLSNITRVIRKVYVGEDTRATILY